MLIRIPEDKDIAQAINEMANGLEGDTILLPPGRFNLMQEISFDTPRIAHDDGSGENQRKSSHIVLKDTDNLRISGSLNPDGTPATVLVASNNMRPQTLQCSVLWAENCNNLKLENIAVEREHSCSFSATVLEIRNGYVQVETTRDYERDELPLYCMNKYSDGHLTGKSITIGFGCDIVMKREEGRIYSFIDEAIAAELSTGERIAFRQSGLTDFSLFFGHCDNLMLENIHVRDAAGYAILTEDCKNITAKRIMIIPQKGELAAVSRDGWKIFRSSGRVVVEDSLFEGTRMDGQNVHANYLTVTHKDGNTITCDLKYSHTPLRPGTTVENDRTGEKWEVMECELLSFRLEQGKQSKNPTSGKIVPDRKSRINTYRITLASSSGIEEGDRLTPSSHIVDEYICRNSIFRNIAGCGQIIKARKAVIDNCIYEHLMCPGILAGSEIDTHYECRNPEKVTISNCTFLDCGHYPRYGSIAKGAIASVAQGCDDTSCGDFSAENCTFTDCPVTAELRNVGCFTLKHCTSVPAENGMTIQQQ